MKRTLFILVWMAVCQTGFAQSIDSLFNYFKDEEGAESIHVPPIIMKLGRHLMMPYDDPENLIVKGIDSITVLDLEESPENVKQHFKKEVKRLKFDEYETWIQAKADGDNVRIMAKVENDVVKEFVILSVGEGDCMMAKIKGKIKREDMQAIINDEQIMIDERK